MSRNVSFGFVLALLAPFHAAAQTLDTHWDRIPDFCASPTRVSEQSGLWSDPATWGGTLPTRGDVVLVHAAHEVKLDVPTAQLACLGIKGRLASTGRFEIAVGTLVVYGSGHLVIGTPQAPASGEIVILDTPLNLAADQGQYGTGVLVFGEIAMSGISKSAFVRLAGAALVGATTLTLAEPVKGWAVGDVLAIGDTRQLTDVDHAVQIERPVIASISGTTVALKTPLAYAHVGPGGMLPHVANISRSVTIRSAWSATTRGHVLITDQAEADIRYTRFQDLGRTTNDDLHPTTNHIGRYPLHIHHLQAAFTVLGNAIVDSRKWALTVHGSNFGLVQDNVVVAAQGWGIGTEDGSETANKFDHNIVMGVTGGPSPRDMDGRSGAGFWFRGFNNIVTRNVSTSSEYAGFELAAADRPGQMARYASRPGANTMTGMEGVDYETRDIKFTPIREFADNEAYGHIKAGLVIWNLGNGNDYIRLSNPAYGAASDTMPPSLVRNFTVWNAGEEGIYAYPMNHVTFTGFTAVASPFPPVLACPRGYWAGDYETIDITFERANIQGMCIGIDVSTDSKGAFVIRDSVIHSVGADILVPMFGAPGSKDLSRPRRVTILNTRLGGSNKILPQFRASDRDDIAQTNEVFVLDYQGVSRDSFRVFYPEQRADQIMPQSGTNGILIGCPAAGMTNQQCFDAHLVATGGIDPSTVCAQPVSRPGVGGLVCPIVGTPSLRPGCLACATFVSQRVPTMLPAGAKVDVTVAYRNTSDLTWTTEQGYALASVSPARAPGIWGPSTVSLQEPVPPGATVTFRFRITAPPITGGYNIPFQWRMARKGAVFGDVAPDVGPFVNGGAQP